MTSRALFEPVSPCRRIGIIGFPFPLEHIVARGKNYEFLAFFLHILLSPLAAQGVVDVFLTKSSDIIRCLKISDVRQRFDFDIPHHPGMKRSLPLQIGPFVAPFTGLRAGEGSFEPVSVLAHEFSFLVKQLLLQSNRRHYDDHQRHGENSADDQRYLRNLLRSLRHL